MKNKILRIVIGYLYSKMNHYKRDDIYNSYETIGDICHLAGLKDGETKLRFISYQYK